MEWHPNDEILLEWASNDEMTMCWRGYWLGMSEWFWDERNLRIKCFALDQEFSFISPHLVIPHHSWMMKLLGMKWKWLEWVLNDIFPVWFSFLIILDILKWPRNGGMRGNGGVLEGKINTEFWDTCHSAIIWSFQYHSNKNLFSHTKWVWDDSRKLQKMEWHLNDGMTFKWLKTFWHKGCTITLDPLCANSVPKIIFSRMDGKWHLNGGMTFKWWNDIQMMILAQRDTITLDPPLCQQCAKNASERWNDIQIMEWHSNDGMTFKWWNDI